jgi:hypothetical protein
MRGYARAVVLYGIASAISNDVDDWHLTGDEAQATLATILRDEPDLRGVVWIEAIDLSAYSPN